MHHSPKKAISKDVDFNLFLTSPAGLYCTEAAAAAFAAADLKYAGLSRLRSRFKAKRTSFRRIFGASLLPEPT